MAWTLAVPLLFDNLILIVGSFLGVAVLGSCILACTNLGNRYRPQRPKYMNISDPLRSRWDLYGTEEYVMNIINKRIASKTESEFLRKMECSTFDDIMRAKVVMNVNDVKKEGLTSVLKQQHLTELRSKRTFSLPITCHSKKVGQEGKKFSYGNGFFVYGSDEENDESKENDTIPLKKKEKKILVVAPDHVIPRAGYCDYSGGFNFNCFNCVYNSDYSIDLRWLPSNSGLKELLDDAIQQMCDSTNEAASYFQQHLQFKLKLIARYPSHDISILEFDAETSVAESRALYKFVVEEFENSGLIAHINDLNMIADSRKMESIMVGYYFVTSNATDVSIDLYVNGTEKEIELSSKKLTQFFACKELPPFLYAELIVVPCEIGEKWVPRCSQFGFEIVQFIFFIAGCGCIGNLCCMWTKDCRKTKPQLCPSLRSCCAENYIAGQANNDSGLSGSTAFSNGRRIGMLHGDYDGSAVFCSAQSIFYCVKDAMKKVN